MAKETTCTLAVKCSPEQEKELLRDCGRALAPTIMQMLEEIRQEKAANKAA